MGICVAQGIHGLMDEALVDRSEQFLHAALHIVFGERIAVVQPVEDFQRVFLRLLVDYDDVQRLVHLQIGFLQPVAIDGHQHRAVAEGATLVHA
ncbi:MAG: hypothetical protein ABSF99_07065, partial [Anaerolineales bacterium]